MPPYSQRQKKNTILIFRFSKKGKGFSFKLERRKSDSLHENERINLLLWVRFWIRGLHDYFLRGFLIQKLDKSFRRFSSWEEFFDKGKSGSLGKPPNSLLSREDFCE